MADTYREEFEFAGSGINVELELLPGETESMIRDFIRKDNFAEAEVAVIVSAVRKVEIDGEIKYRNSTRAARRGNANVSTHFPRLRDSETFETLLERILKIIITKEVWLAKKEPFDEVFDVYYDAGFSSNRANPTPSPESAPDQ